MPVAASRERCGVCRGREVRLASLEGGKVGDCVLHVARGLLSGSLNASRLAGGPPKKPLRIIVGRSGSVDGFRPPRFADNCEFSSVLPLWARFSSGVKNACRRIRACSAGMMSGKARPDESG